MVASLAPHGNAAAYAQVVPLKHLAAPTARSGQMLRSWSAAGVYPAGLPVLGTRTSSATASTGSRSTALPLECRHSTFAGSSSLGAAGFSAAALLAALLRVSSSSRRWRRQTAAVVRRGNITGPGWTDELARVFDPDPQGPTWKHEGGYRGRPTLRVLLDGEDLVHSYAQAEYKRTGKWTGPLSEGLEKAIFYGAWRGGVPELDPMVDRQKAQPEILTFVAMPADLIESVNPACVCDGFPEDLRKKLQRCVLGEEGYFINDFIRSLQDSGRLLTWKRPARLPGGAPRPNALLEQKYYQMGKPIPFKGLRAMPILLSQAMGAGTALKVGDKVEALKSGRLRSGKWMPSKWMKAEVVSANYDGTFDLQFEMTFGPYRDRRMKGLKGAPTLSLRKNEVFKDFGADSMPAEFRLMQEMNFMQGVPASQIRLPGMLDRISDTYDIEGNQDWFLCSSKQFLMTASVKSLEASRVDQFKRQFQFGYKWVETEEGLQFEPVPNTSMSISLQTSHSEVAKYFPGAENADEEARRKLQEYKEEMDEYAVELEQIAPVREVTPLPAGPKGRGLLVGQKLEPVQKMLQ